MVELVPAPPEVHAEPGNLHATLSGERLLVPQDVLKALSPQRFRNAEEFHTYLSAFPTACATALHWSVDDCVQAAQKLGVTLGSNKALHPREPGMGAMDPKLLEP